jgi:hypothetical protein
VSATIIASTTVYGSMMKNVVVVPTKLLSTPVENGQHVQAEFAQRNVSNESVAIHRTSWCRCLRNSRWKRRQTLAPAWISYPAVKTRDNIGGMKRRQRRGVYTYLRTSRSTPAEIGIERPASRAQRANEERGQLQAGGHHGAEIFRRSCAHSISENYDLPVAFCRFLCPTLFPQDRRPCYKI